ncbi:helix-turn-helix transcriptional regulator [Novosphingobium malaysiense]|uniref:AlpA family phage regulatory protein n=1 Tax=Novosphingobium malaysiense TaxID=1348853 RepID=A0A0B1ZWM6_9SPHN|nr:AlpA family phage regulatory protein [Novosphingobium malaysiense]KHK93557.1 hypothetical protein LK12_04755 [Novosphingobium malaysiense]
MKENPTSCSGVGNGAGAKVNSNRYLRQPEVLERVGVSWMTLLRWEKQGRFPRRRKIGPRIVAWPEAEIVEWCASREIAPAVDKGAAK